MYFPVRKYHEDGERKNKKNKNMHFLIRNYENKLFIKYKKNILLVKYISNPCTVIVVHACGSGWV